MKNFLKKIQRTFFEGVIALLPISLTLYISYLIFKGLFKLFSVAVPFLPDPFKDIFYIEMVTVVLTFLMFFIGVLFIGFLAKTVIGNFLNKTVENVLTSLPLIRTIYKAFKQLFNLIFTTSEDKKYSKIVMVEFPNKGKWVIGFLTGKCNEKLSPTKDKEYYTVFLPTTPNPTTGYLLIFPKDEIVETSLSMDEAIRLLLSGGIIKE
ncbi:MAG: hypothetical protein A2086_00510 [Spirochaetes bacterium GWD1_27_9]|nr:MAG: hypothetical protein A2Z98_03950 [Spirochaetes bacterium GWB1_27_13]OHD23295.1 MAG: hypothetical protein A2Y34_11525 [Spirochaetes bacterium GWC1_27_15]OHD39819.1 MAG: hypothetical protein A2086_00510 [Spirochaetes bacterium GWD1_27_9]